MSRLSIPACPFDTWKDGRNDNLSGGRLLAVLSHRFAYAFFDAQTGRFTNGFIAGMQHGEDILTLLTTHVDEMALLLPMVLERMGEVDGYNIYANEGQAAGMTISNHAHLHVVRRNDGERASGMGLGKLVAEFNALGLAYDTLAYSLGT